MVAFLGLSTYRIAHRPERASGRAERLAGAVAARTGGLDAHWRRWRSRRSSGR
jgi:hypothetical protein